MKPTASLQITESALSAGLSANVEKHGSARFVVRVVEEIPLLESRRGMWCISTRTGEVINLHHQYHFNCRKASTSLTGWSIVCASYAGSSCLFSKSVVALPRPCKPHSKDEMYDNLILSLDQSAVERTIAVKIRSCGNAHVYNTRCGILLTCSLIGSS